MDEAFKEAVRTHKIANVILFARNIESKEQVKRLCEEIQALVRKECGTDAIIGIDQEGGMVTRLSEDCTNVPSAMAISATGESSSAYEVGVITASELNALGIMCDFAPVLDVNSNKANPVIGVRSYGDTKARVIEYGLAMAEGLQSKGIMAVGKHFPGHGDTHLDSHLSLPKVVSDRQGLEEHIEPFRRAINAGIEGIMSSHILFPALEEKEIPATMSRSILTDFLKGELGFKGLVFTDCMEMQAIARYYGTVEASLSALQAGADLVCISHHADLACKAIDLVSEALEDGRLSKEELSASTEKILLAKAMLADQKRLDFSLVGCNDHKQRSRHLVEKSLCLVNDRDFQVGQEPLFVAPRISPSPRSCPPSW
jgi:beta-N-acetylhexosaminidase